MRGPHIHDWTKWTSAGKLRVFDSDLSSVRPSDILYIQQKHCIVCDKIKLRRVKY